MKLLRTVLLVLVMLGACGCITINVPDPPDVEIHGEVNTDNGADDTDGADGGSERRQ